VGENYKITIIEEHKKTVSILQHAVGYKYSNNFINISKYNYYLISSHGVGGGIW